MHLSTNPATYPESNHSTHDTYNYAEPALPPSHTATAATVQLCGASTLITEIRTRHTPPATAANSAAYSQMLQQRPHELLACWQCQLLACMSASTFCCLGVDGQRHSHDLGLQVQEQHTHRDTQTEKSAVLNTRSQSTPPLV